MSVIKISTQDVYNKNVVKDPNYKLNNEIILQNIWLKKYINQEVLYTPHYEELLRQISLMDQGGFEHGMQSELYVLFQNDSRYSSTRLSGWSNLLNLALSFTDYHTLNSEKLIVDFLAGSGTLAQRNRQLSFTCTPTVIGLDVSQKMCEQAKNLKEIVFWGSHQAHPFKKEVSDVIIAAYGFHHIPDSERQEFIANMKSISKPNGVCIIHDFEENSNTARWYSEAIHSFRPNGHPYTHITVESIIKILDQYFNHVETRWIYDPFYLQGMENQDEQMLKQEFFAYLIGLFNLQKLLPKGISMKNLKTFKDMLYWEKIESFLSPFFSLNETEENRIQEKQLLPKLTHYKTIKVPIVKNLTLQRLNDGKLCLIAPRVALVGVGYGGKK